MLGVIPRRIICRMKTDLTWQQRLKRLWQPRNPLFWLMIFFNGLSSVLAWVLHLAAPQGWMLQLVTVLALGNALAGIGLLWRLWAESAPSDPGTAHSQGWPGS